MAFGLHDGGGAAARFYLTSKRIKFALVSIFRATSCCGNILMNVTEAMVLIATRRIRALTRKTSLASSFCHRRRLLRDLVTMRHAMMTAAAAVALFASSAVAKAECIKITPGGNVRVELSEHEPERNYCFAAKAGQSIDVRTSNMSGIEPAGHIVAPSGAMDGGPGSPMFTGTAKETGTYQIIAGQRGPKKSGSYNLSVTVR